VIAALRAHLGPLVGVALAGLAIVAISEWIRRRFGPAAEWTRKLVHVLMGLLSLSLPYVFHSPWPVVLLCAAFAFVLGITMLLGLLSSVHGVERASGGVVLYPVAVALLFWLTAKSPGFYVVCILVMTVCDAAAVLVGSEYGRHIFHIHGSVKRWRAARLSAHGVHRARASPPAPSTARPAC
jgi:phytol kinase